MDSVLESATTLSDDHLAAIADLERRVVAADGGRLKLEYGVLRSRDGARASDFLWRDDAGTVQGFLGVYAFGGSKPELAGMVDPDHRRQGIGTALLDAALGELRDRGKDAALLVVPRDSVGGHVVAEGRSAPLEHSEHALVLRGEPTEGPSDPAISLRAATIEDAEVVGDLLAAGFGWRPPDVAESLARPAERERAAIIEWDGTAVGYCRLSQEGEVGGVYGFVVDPALQGRGIGRDALRRFCRTLRADGATRVGLEVAVDNERALGLYTSIGFEPVTTEDYYELTV